MNQLENIIKKMSEDYEYAAKVLANPMSVNDDNTGIEPQGHDSTSITEMAEFLDMECKPEDPGWTRDTLIFVNDSTIDDEVQLVYFYKFLESGEYPYICVADGATSMTSDVYVSWKNAWSYEKYKDKAIHISGNTWRLK